MPLTDTNASDGPSSAAWDQMETATPRVKQVLAEQIEDKKPKQNKKKDK